jgi:L-alanine-DL-glutamate epimerase-like enolase superfamily enzyme
MDPGAAWIAMARAVRNMGRPRVAATAIAAIDAAIWDLKARLLDVPLVTLLGAVRPGVDLYGSGGFTSYPLDRLAGPVCRLGERWNRARQDEDRTRRGGRRRARQGRARCDRPLGGAVRRCQRRLRSRKRALAVAEAIAPFDVTWFEEPVSSDDLEGLRLMRDRSPAAMEIAAGEYGYDLFYFRRMLEAGAVDVLQADATRCAGITGFLQVGALCDAFAIPLSAHTAPSLHLAPCCALGRVRHIEYFHDHVRIEQMLFDGAPQPRPDGCLYPDLSRPGLGLELKRSDASRWEVR